MTADVWTVHLPEYSPSSPNAKQRGHWRGRKRDADRAYTWLCMHVRDPLPRFAGAVSLTIERVWAPPWKAMDFDNIVAGSKPLIDGLTSPRGLQTKGLGIFGDDDQDHVEALNVRQRRAADGETPGTIITVSGRFAE